MTLEETIKKLYSTRISDRLEVLKYADYPTDLKNLSFAIATGYQFFIHTGKKMQLFFDDDHSSLIYQTIQPWLPIPELMLGTIVKLENGYLHPLMNIQNGSVPTYCFQKGDDFGRIEVPQSEYQNIKDSQRRFQFINADNTVVDYPVWNEERYQIFWSQQKSDRRLDDESISQHRYCEASDDPDLVNSFEEQESHWREESDSCGACGATSGSECLISDPQDCVRGFW